MPWFKRCPLVALSIIVCQSHAEENQSGHNDDFLPQSAVVSLFTYDPLGLPAFHATGFFISADGLIATNRHVVENSSKVAVQTSDGRGCAVLGVVAEDPVHDLVIVRVSGTGYPFLRLGSFEEIQPGDQVRVICDEYGFAGKIIHGTVANVENLADDYQWFSINAATKEGESGSPVLDEAGQVIGVMSAQIENHTKGWVVSVDSIRELMVSASHGVSLQPVTNLENRAYLELYEDPNLAPALKAAYYGENQEAVRRMILVCGDFPRSAAAFALLGSYYSRLHMWKEASDAFTRAISIKPDYAFAIASLGAVLAEQGKTEEAMNTTKKAEQLATESKSHFADTWYNVGGVLILEKDYNGARKVIQLLRDFHTANGNHSADQLTAILSHATK